MGQRGAAAGIAFSPLVVGAIGATSSHICGFGKENGPFSPLVVGAIGATPSLSFRCSMRPAFQSPCRRGNRCNGRGLALLLPTLGKLSVPLSSGQSVQQGGIQMSNAISAFLSVPLSSGQSVQPEMPRFGLAFSHTLSVPLSSGQSVQLQEEGLTVFGMGHFQSPCRRGNRCNI